MRFNAPFHNWPVVEFPPHIDVITAETIQANAITAETMARQSDAAPPLRDNPELVNPYAAQLLQMGATDFWLVAAAVRSCRARGTHARWTIVNGKFHCGRQAARDLCRRFELDPDELV